VFAQAAANHVPIAVSRPDSSPAIAYHELAEQLTGVNAR
jgi:MinD-like ATPase involved in chromosome partitioning or flagellar assembly